MKKPNKLLTNEHLLKDLPNNFALAEAAIEVAHNLLEAGHTFNLQKVLNSVVKAKEIETEVSVEIKEGE